MKKTLLGGTALVSAAAVGVTAVVAAEAPSWKLTGNANFQFYWVNQDTTASSWSKVYFTWDGPETLSIIESDTCCTLPQDHSWYFGVDEAELQLNVSGMADNGLSYGFKVELNANTTDGSVTDEVRLQFSGGWGTLQMGDEDGAEDIMNYGGESLMGATGGFDGDQDDYLFRITDMNWQTKAKGTPGTFGREYEWGNGDATSLASALRAPSYPTIAGDTSDGTKVSYFSPRFSGFQIGASITPTPNNGDDFKADGDWENHIGVGANYDNSFGDFRIRASTVYSGASYIGGNTKIDDVSAWSVGGIVGWGPFSLGANYTDNGTVRSSSNETIDKYYWDAAASFETGPLMFSLGYFQGVTEIGGGDWLNVFWGDEWTYSHAALTADYTIAPGLATYAEINVIEDDADHKSHETTSFVAGVNVSF